jgi:oxygen-dependent protoporphyrinogen oxidase
MTSPAGPPVIAIVGGGIAGLAAAFFLRDSGAAVTVLEGAPRLGGKLSVSPVAGIAVDEGAEALLARRPEGTELIGAAGLGGQLVLPGTTAAGLWTRGQLRPLPRRQFFGVPADLDELGDSQILSAAGLARARAEDELPALVRADDVSVAELISARFGPELADRLVDPLLGGVYAGRSQELSFEATLPGLAKAARHHRTLGAAARSLLPGPAAAGPPAASPVFTTLAGGPGTLPTAVTAGPPAGSPVFTTLAGGLGTLPAAVAAACGAVVRTNAMIRGLARTPTGWELTVGPASSPERFTADAVILALPGRPAGRLLARVSPAASSALGEIGYASMAIVTLAYPQAAFPALPPGSGYLVPAVDRRAVKAVTFSTSKWPHLLAAGQQLVIVRCSIGRMGEESVLQREDKDLAALAMADLAAATGVRGDPADTRVSRWGGGLPQYTVGHLDRVARIRAGLAAQPGLAGCGAAYDGIGIPACIASARLAADQVLDYLRSRSGQLAPGRVRAWPERAGTWLAASFGDVDAPVTLSWSTCGPDPAARLGMGTGPGKRDGDGRPAAWTGLGRQWSYGW